jgi:hypothetical protein
LKPIIPEQRDVDAAYSMAMADLADARRCDADFGRGSDVAKTAWAAYQSSERHWRETRDLVAAAAKADAS